MVVEEAKHLQIPTKITQRDIDGFLKRIDQTRSEARSSGIGGWYSDFKTWPEVNAKLSQFASDSPEVVTLFEVGTTHEGRTMWGVRITAPGDSTNRNRILFNFKPTCLIICTNKVLPRSHYIYEVNLQIFRRHGHMEIIYSQCFIFWGQENNSNYFSRRM